MSSLGISAQIAINLLQKFLRSLGRRIDFPVDQHAAGIPASRSCELPSDLVTFPRQFAPLRCLDRVLLQPEMALVIRERPQFGTPVPAQNMVTDPPYNC